VTAHSAAPPGWRVVKTITVTGPNGYATELTSVAAASPGDAWAVGGAQTESGSGPALLEHWDGGSWHSQALPASVARFWNHYGGSTSQDLVAASSAGNVWAFGNTGDYIRLSGRHWSDGKIPGASITAAREVLFTAVQAFSRKNVWVFGSIEDAPDSPRSHPYASQYNGHTWVRRSFPGTGSVVAVSSLSSRNMWAVAGTAINGDAGAPAVLRWNGTAWAPVTVQPPPLPSGASWTTIEARSSTNVWIAGGGERPDQLGSTVQEVAHWTGGPAWTVTTIPAKAVPAGFDIVSIVPDGASGLWGLDSLIAGLGEYSAVPARPGSGAARRLASFQGCSLLWHVVGTAWTGPTAMHDYACLADLARVPDRASVWGVGSTRYADGLIALTGPKP
jgi:hypothetical protein